MVRPQNPGSAQFRISGVQSGASDTSKIDNWDSCKAIDRRIMAGTAELASIDRFLHPATTVFHFCVGWTTDASDRNMTMRIILLQFILYS